MQAGATLVQVRDPDADDDAFLAMARDVVETVRGTGVPVLLDDRVHLVAAAGADGAHVGQSDMPVAQARAILGPDPILGLSVETGEQLDWAVAHLGRLLAAVESRGSLVAERGGSLMVTVASGGESPFVLARHATAIVERRTVPGERSEAALAEVEHLLVHLRLHDDTVSARARLVVARDPWQLDDSGPAAALAADLHRALGDDAASEPFHAPYWMEAPLWQAAGIPTAIYYPKPLHLQTAFAPLGYTPGAFPVSEDCARRIFSLPMHPYLAAGDQRRIATLMIRP